MKTLIGILVGLAIVSSLAFGVFAGEGKGCECKPCKCCECKC